MGAGAWLGLPASNTTINDDVVQQDPQRWEVAYKMWAGVPLPPEVTLSRHLHTVNTVHGPQKKAVPLSTSHLLSCTKGGHCNARHNDVRDEISKMCRTAGMQVSRECLLPEVRRVVNGVRESRLSQLRTDLRTTDDRGNHQHYDVAITQPTRKEGDHKKVLSAANRRERQKLSKYGCNERSYKSDDIHLLPWREKPVIPLVAETRGGLSKKKQRADQPVCRCHTGRVKRSPGL